MRFQKNNFFNIAGHVIFARPFWFSKNDSCLQKQFKMAKLMSKHHVWKLKTP
jgi:hypothetical protein